MTTQQTPPQESVPTDDRQGRSDPDQVRWVVGVDGSPGARAALVWALGAAAGAGATLEVVSCYPVEFFWMDPYLLDTRRLDEIREDSESRARALLAEVRDDAAVAAVPGAAGVVATVVVAAGAPAEHLVDRAGEAQLLVVGSRGRSGARSTLLGSVALHCVAHAPCPVVVVHPGAPSLPPRVVVGIEDSAMSRAALVTAAGVAQQLGAELEIVAAYQAEPFWSDVYAATLPPAPNLRAQVQELAEQIVAEVLGAETDARLLVEEGPPAQVLTRAADGAALLVVGSHSRSRIAGMLLGSVALHCAVQAPCPVMVVHTDRGRSAGQPAGAAATAVTT